MTLPVVLDPAPLVGTFASVDALEQAMREHPQITIEPVHRFADGVYSREITIPKGTLLTGKIHKTRHLNIISAGKISVWSPTEGVREITAPFSFVAEPGTRRVGFAHEDTVWTCVHATQETDLAKIEAEVIEPHDSSLLVATVDAETVEALCRG